MVASKELLQTEESQNGFLEPFAIFVRQDPQTQARQETKVTLKGILSEINNKSYALSLAKREATEPISRGRSGRRMEKGEPEGKRKRISKVEERLALLKKRRELIRRSNPNNPLRIDEETLQIVGGGAQRPPEEGAWLDFLVTFNFTQFFSHKDIGLARGAFVARWNVIQTFESTADEEQRRAKVLAFEEFNKSLSSIKDGQFPQELTPLFTIISRELPLGGYLQSLMGR